MDSTTFFAIHKSKYQMQNRQRIVLSIVRIKQIDRGSRAYELIT
jgi:hypothetical protein